MSRKSSWSSVTLSFCHVVPPSSVRNTVASAPLAHATLSLTALTPRSRTATPLVCIDQCGVANIINVNARRNLMSPNLTESVTFVPLVARIRTHQRCDPHSPMIGQLLLHYRVVEKIGEGGQGTVFKVIDTTLDRPAVIKVLPPDLTDSASNLVRFEREAKLASSLDHPNICTIFGLHKVGDVQFIAMQYVEGRNVREIVGGKPLDLRRALSIAIQVTDALAAAHSRGIVHRDIKARNVMVTRTGTVKVLDFGLAKLIGSPHSASSDPQLTEVGVPYGTSTYAAPEQAQGLKADHRADIFSTGVLLYEMLAGTWPFRGKTALDVRYAVVYHKPKPIVEARGEDSTALRRIQEILDKALAKVPEDRYQRIEDMRRDLQEVLREIEVDTSVGRTLTESPRTTIARRPNRFWTTPRILTATAVVLLAIVALSLIAFR